MSTRERVEYYCERLFNRPHISDSVWNTLRCSPRFRTVLDDAKTKKTMKFVRLAYLAEGGMIQREGWKKPSAQEGYRQRVQFVRNMFLWDILKGPVHRFSPDEFDVIRRPDIFTAYRRDGRELRIKPNWKAMAERWSIPTLGERVQKPDTFRKQYHRAVQALGEAAPMAAFTLADILRCGTNMSVLGKLCDQCEDAIGRAEVSAGHHAMPERESLSQYIHECHEWIGHLFLCVAEAESRDELVGLFPQVDAFYLRSPVGLSKNMILHVGVAHGWSREKVGEVIRWSKGMRGTIYPGIEPFSPR